MKEIEVLTEVKAPDLEQIYSLGGTGVVFLAEGESFIEKPKFYLLEELERGAGRERFTRQPVSNLAFHYEEGEWRNKNAFMGVQGFDESILKVLAEPKATSLRFLDVDEGLKDLSKISRMVEIGFNVGGGEIVLKRILLPKVYTDKMILGDEVWLGEAKGMSDVFIDAWDKLGVGDYDFNWNERVRNHLLGNVRDLDKKIEYEMKDGQKYVEWDGEWMWAGLLSDVNDIDRFLAEERKLASLGVGEYLVTEYSHNDGGAVSAGTAGEQEEEDVIRDVQMMGEDGKIHQRAVEGKKGEIEGLVNNLVNNMKQEYGFVDGVNQKFEVVERKIESQMAWMEITRNSFNWVGEELINSDLGVESMSGMEVQMNNEGMEIPDWGIVWQSEIRSDSLINIDSDEVFLSESIVDEEVEEIEESEGKWLEEEGEDNGRENEPDDSDDNGGGGLGLVRVKIKNDSLVNEMKKEHGFISKADLGVEVSNNQVEVVGEIKEFNQIGVEVEKRVEMQKRREVVETVETTEISVEDELVVENKQSEIEPPIWKVQMEPWFDDIPVFEFVEQELSIVIPTLKVVSEEKNIDWAWVAGLVLLVVSDTFSQQERVRIPVINGEVMVNRGSGW